MRKTLGDTRLGIEGPECRLPAIASEQNPLTTFDPDDSYIEPSYLLNQADARIPATTRVPRVQ